MRLIPRFRRRRPAGQEYRAGYTDGRIDARVAAATSGPAVAEATAAVELAAGLIGHCFAMAEVKGGNIATTALNPEFMAMLGRCLIVGGELVAMIEVDAGAVSLRPAANFDISGGPNPRSWIYRLDLPGPTRPEARTVPGDGVIHARYSCDPARPWQGLGPLQRAGLSAKLVATLEQRLGQESGGRVGYLLMVPAGVDGQDESVSRLRQDLAGLAGQTALMETTADGWGEGRDAAPRRDLQPQRIGPDIPRGNIELRRDAGLGILGACGVPPGLFAGGDGTAQRESWRRFLHGTLQPLARQTAVELSAKLDAPDLEFNLDRLFASDLSGRARALGSMVQAGLDLNAALELAGLNE